MDVEVFVHGVPHGEDFWGKDDRERKFLSTFYSGRSDALKLVIQTRKLENKLYTYYSYIVGKDVQDFLARPGSYFGLTIRLDSYYKDFSQFFYILNLVFQKTILDVILKKNGNGFQYKVSKFADAKISDIASCIVNLIATYCKEGKVSNLSNVVGSMPGKKLNIYDASEQDVKDAIQKGATVSLSPYFPTKGQIEKEMNYEKQKASLQAELENQKANVKTQIEMTKKQKDIEKKDEVDNLNKQNSTLQEANSTLLDKVSSLSKKVSSLESILEKIRLLCSNLGGPATASHGKFGNFSTQGGDKHNGPTSEEGKKDTNTPTKEDGRKKSFFNLLKNIQPILVILILIIVVVGFAQMTDNKEKDPNGNSDETPTDTVPKPNALDFKVYSYDDKEKVVTGDPLQEVNVNNTKWYAAILYPDSTRTDSVNWTIEGATAGATRTDTLTFLVTSIPKDNLVRICCVKDSKCYYKELKVK